MNTKNIYFDMRLGGITLNPLIAVINFLMLSYLVIENVIPFWLFVPLFLVGVFILYSIVGNKFRQIQQTTDVNLVYEKATEQAKTNIEILKQLALISETLKIPKSVLLESRLNYLQEIAQGKK